MNRAIILLAVAMLSAVSFGQTNAPLATETAGQSYGGSSGGLADNGNDKLWTFRANALFLFRSSLPSRNLLVNGANVPIFNANQFEIPMQPGWDVELLRRLASDSAWTVEARYFNIGGPGIDSPTIASANGAGVPGANTAAGLFFPPVDSSLRYKSQVQNAEANLQCAVCDNLNLLAGVRYINVNDRILASIAATSGGFSAANEMAAENHLIGLQIGGDAVLWQQDRFRVEAILKAGIFDNYVRNFLVYNSDSLSTHAQTGVHAERAACCGDLALLLTYRLTEDWSIRGGYQMLSVDNVALASSQAAANPVPLTSRATTVKTTGNLLYLGGTFGLECRL